MSAPRISRRQLAAMAGAAFSTLMSAGCGGGSARRGARLTARPSATATTLPAGINALGLGRARDGVVYVPDLAKDGPVPLMVLCHGAGGDGAGFLQHLESLADTFPGAVLAPDSVGPTWDAVHPQYRDALDVMTGRRHLLGFGPDVAFIDRALDRVFRTIAVDPTRVAIAGFSDGATYALSLGLINGDLFQRIVGFSPGFIIEGVPHGRPRILISHGRADRILPIDRASRRIVPRLRQLGYDVTYTEFDGGHTLPPTIVSEAMTWMSE